MIEITIKNITIIFLIIITLYVFTLFKSMLNLKNISENSWFELESQFRRKVNLISSAIDTLKHSKFDENFLYELNSKNLEFSSSISLKEPSKIEEKEQNLSKSLFNLNQKIASNNLLKQNNDLNKFTETLPQINLIISKLKETYNKETDNFNTKIIGIPNFLIAKLFHFEEKKLFK